MHEKCKKSYLDSTGFKRADTRQLLTSRKRAIWQKVYGLKLRFPERVLSFSTSAWHIICLCILNYVFLFCLIILFWSINPGFSFIYSLTLYLSSLSLIFIPLTFPFPNQGRDHDEVVVVGILVVVWYCQPGVEHEFHPDQ